MLGCFNFGNVLLIQWSSCSFSVAFLIYQTKTKTFFFFFLFSSHNLYNCYQTKKKKKRNHANFTERKTTEYFSVFQKYSAFVLIVLIYEIHEAALYDSIMSASQCKLIFHSVRILNNNVVLSTSKDCKMRYYYLLFFRFLCKCTVYNETLHTWPLLQERTIVYSQYLGLHLTNFCPTGSSTFFSHKILNHPFKGI